MLLSLRTLIEAEPRPAADRTQPLCWETEWNPKRNWDDTVFLSVYLYRSCAAVGVSSGRENGNSDKSDEKRDGFSYSCFAASPRVVNSHVPRTQPS